MHKLIVSPCVFCTKLWSDPDDDSLSYQEDKKLDHIIVNGSKLPFLVHPLCAKPHNEVIFESPDQIECGDFSIVKHLETEFFDEIGLYLSHAIGCFFINDNQWVWLSGQGRSSVRSLSELKAKSELIERMSVTYIPSNVLSDGYFKSDNFRVAVEDAVPFGRLRTQKKASSIRYGIACDTNQERGLNSAYQESVEKVGQNLSLMGKLRFVLDLDHLVINQPFIDFLRPFGQLQLIVDKLTNNNCFVSCLLVAKNSLLMTSSVSVSLDSAIEHALLEMIEKILYVESVQYNLDSQLYPWAFYLKNESSIFSILKSFGVQTKVTLSQLSDYCIQPLLPSFNPPINLDRSNRMTHQFRAKVFQSIILDDLFTHQTLEYFPYG